MWFLVLTPRNSSNRCASRCLRCCTSRYPWAKLGQTLYVPGRLLWKYIKIYGGTHTQRVNTHKTINKAHHMITQTTCNTKTTHWGSNNNNKRKTHIYPSKCLNKTSVLAAEWRRRHAPSPQPAHNFRRRSVFSSDLGVEGLYIIWFSI